MAETEKKMMDMVTEKTKNCYTKTSSQGDWRVYVCVEG